MNYDQQILRILTDVGERGISARLLAKHVYNQNISFFSTPDMAEIYSYVRRFITRNTRKAKPMLERTGRWGYYRLNAHNAAQARQMLLGFSNTEQPEEEKEEKPQQDFSLNLFSDL